MIARLVSILLLGAISSSHLLAANKVPDSPQAGARTYAQNYKDLVLAECIATAYKDESAVAEDAGSSAGALLDWTYFDMEQAPSARKDLIERFLARDYRNPLAESERKGIRFDLLKCLDLYHSKELEKQVKQLVIHPERSYRQDNPSNNR